MRELLESIVFDVTFNWIMNMHEEGLNKHMSSCEHAVTNLTQNLNCYSLDTPRLFGVP